MRAWGQRSWICNLYNQGNAWLPCFMPHQAMFFWPPLPCLFVLRGFCCFTHRSPPEMALLLQVKGKSFLRISPTFIPELLLPQTSSIVSRRPHPTRSRAQCRLMERQWNKNSNLFSPFMTPLDFEHVCDIVWSKSLFFYLKKTEVKTTFEILYQWGFPWVFKNCLCQHTRFFYVPRSRGFKFRCYGPETPSFPKTLWLWEISQPKWERFLCVPNFHPKILHNQYFSDNCLSLPKNSAGFGQEHLGFNHFSSPNIFLFVHFLSVHLLIFLCFVLKKFIFLDFFLDFWFSAKGWFSLIPVETPKKSFCAVDSNQLQGFNKKPRVFPTRLLLMDHGMVLGGGSASVL